MLANHQQHADQSKEDDKANSNMAKVTEESEDGSPIGRSHSDTRTKTAQFNYHECSEEVRLISNQELPLKTKEVMRSDKDVETINEEESA